MPSGPTSLSELIERVRLREGSWSSVQDLDAEPAAVVSAWMDSDDPFAMLLLFAAIHPHHDEPVCDALVASMSFFEPMRRVQRTQAHARGGMNYNGPDPFRFLYLAQRMRGALSALSPAERLALESRLAASIRAVVPNPHALSEEGGDVRPHPRDSSEPR